jgi:hypothetical protein
MHPIVFKDLRTLQGTFSRTFVRPPLDVEHDATIPDIFAHHAAHSPAHPLFVFDEEDGTVRTIGYAEAHRAVRRSAAIVKRDFKRFMLDTNKPADENNLPVVGILAMSSTLISTYYWHLYNIYLDLYYPNQ